MWGRYWSDETEKISRFGSIGYVGLIKGKESGEKRYLCEAGSLSHHEAGEFNTTYDAVTKSLRGRGVYNLFDSEFEVLKAFERKYTNNWELLKVVKIGYTEEVKILDEI